MGSCSTWRYSHTLYTVTSLLPEAGKASEATQSDVFLLYTIAVPKLDPNYPDYTGLLSQFKLDIHWST